MKLRRYISDSDYNVIRDWISDEKTNALWSAGRIDYPIRKELFEEFLQEIHDRTKDEPFVAVNEEDRAVGFYSLSVNEETREGMLKFIVVDPEERGKGTAREMLRMAVNYVFTNTEAKAVHLNVFSENIRARKCYEKAGFVVRDVTPAAFTYKDETWDRINMIIRKSEIINGE